MRWIWAFLTLWATTYAAPIGVDDLLKSGDYQGAFELLMESNESSLDDEEILYLMGVTAFQGKNSALYLKEYIQKFPKGKHIEEAKRYLADYYSSSGMQITAEKMYPEIPKILDNNHRDLYRIALCKQQAGDFESACNAFENLADARDGEFHDWAMLGLANCFYLKGDYSLAANSYKQLIEKGPDSPCLSLALIGMMQTCLKQSRYADLVQYNEMYTEKFPDSPSSAELEAAIDDIEAPNASQKIPQGLKAAYFIQAGVFSKESNARACLRKFKDAGYKAHLKEFREEGQKFYRALLGPFKDEAAAKETKHKLEQSQGEKLLIVIQ